MKNEKCDVVYVSTEVIHLDQLLKWMGLSETGGQARYFIDGGKVKLNGTVVFERRKKIYSGDQLTIDGQEYNIQREIECGDANK
jgi:ribosome-associated protein